MNYLSEITICGKSISINNPTYFIADIDPTMMQIWEELRS
ncbi:hypothetical protein LSPH24S_05697 [Lysinibacillus sphaericus]